MPAFPLLSVTEWAWCRVSTPGPLTSHPQSLHLEPNTPHHTPTPGRPSTTRPSSSTWRTSASAGATRPWLMCAPSPFIGKLPEFRVVELAVLPTVSSPRLCARVRSAGPRNPFHDHLLQLGRHMPRRALGLRSLVAVRRSTPLHASSLTGLSNLRFGARPWCALGRCGHVRCAPPPLACCIALHHSG